VEMPCKIVNADQMRVIDQATISQYGISGLVLMENAGLACVSEIERYIKKHLPLEGKIKIFCGVGNNGGDGYVIARHMVNRGYELDLYLIGDSSKLSEETRINAAIFSNLGNTSIAINEENKLDLVAISANDLVIDAILGNGIKGPLQGLILGVVLKINQSGAKVIAIDIPTGLPANKPDLTGEAIKADLTLALGLPKISEVLYKTKNYVGELKILDIGFPRKLLTSNDLKNNLISKTDVVNFFPRRAKDGHKGNMGNVCVLAGSVGMTGAAILSTKAAFLTGAGLVKLGIPKSLNEIAEKNLVETLTYPLEQTVEQSVARQAYDAIKKMSKDATAMLIGPGLSLNPETKQLVKKIIKEFKIPLVIDADGLTALSEDLSVLDNKPTTTILTPHIGEMSRLTNQTREAISSDPISCARDFAMKWKVVIVLKSASTIIADTEGNIWVNPLGNDGMAKAGSGDVLAGLITGFLAQGINGVHAAIIGTWIHSLAGDAASIKKGTNSMLATDILEAVFEAIKATLSKDFPS